LGAAITWTCYTLVDFAVAIVIKVITELGFREDFTNTSGFPLAVVTALYTIFALPSSCGSLGTGVTASCHAFIDTSVAIVIKVIAKLGSGQDFTDAIGVPLSTRADLQAVLTASLS
jgi:hypothetical protein